VNPQPFVKTTHAPNATQTGVLTNILVVAHAPLATAMLDVLRHVHGTVPQGVYAVDVLADEDTAAVAQRITHLVGTVPSLVLTDLPGATPHNCATQACKDLANSLFISPLTAPLLLRAVNYRSLPLQALHDKLTQS
jgi:PTS system ascorbate-specific IIA component